jgi:hypothetical protein
MVLLITTCYCSNCENQYEYYVLHSNGLQRLVYEK